MLAERMVGGAPPCSRPPARRGAPGPAGPRSASTAARRRPSRRAAFGVANDSAAKSARAGPRHSPRAWLRWPRASSGRRRPGPAGLLQQPLELVAVELAGLDPQPVAGWSGGRGRSRRPAPPRPPGAGGRRRCGWSWWRCRAAGRPRSCRPGRRWGRPRRRGRAGRPAPPCRGRRSACRRRGSPPAARGCGTAARRVRVVGPWRSAPIRLQRFLKVRRRPCGHRPVGDLEGPAGAAGREEAGCHATDPRGDRSWSAGPPRATSGHGTSSSRVRRAGLGGGAPARAVGQRRRRQPGHLAAPGRAGRPAPPA